ncbi:hypothetical protein [Nostoc sp. TCL26-01]|uniref:hypothetical protein n=1 Tax=Nostoc sp. TCL26-01 TaxID=2576904 RepID=UPI0015C07503|nr:hypothetical protein [Nostoc sp. TCL26-01]QLE56037.1 hypothetical protein FD725_11160 [Nostoc sp. TCL26-01]
MKFLAIFSHRKQQARLLSVVIGFAVAILLITCSTANSQTTTRDPWLWPFSSTSIWNLPIGSGARYIPANIQRAYWRGADEEYLFKLKSTDPLRPVYTPGSWTKRCAGVNTTNLSLPVPDNLIVSDASLEPYSTPNNAAAFLLPDGKTLVQLGVLARCLPGGPIYGWHYFPDMSLYWNGSGGGHFGSGLSVLGGSVRKGELTNNQPIRHALKVVLWGKKYLYYGSDRKGFRWPADRADNEAPTIYGGTNPALVQGSLLAIPPYVTETTLRLQTPAGKKLFKALQNYGAYVVEDAGWDAHYLELEKGVVDEFRRAYGYDFNGSTGVFHEDFMKLFQALNIIDNNGPDTIGGGGITRRAPLAPPLTAPK